MKKIVLFASVLLLACCMTACGGGAPDQSTPEGPAKAVFSAARSGDFSGLKDLCDPKGEGDGDTKRICELATDEGKRDDFIEAFKDGKVTGDAKVMGDKAEVPIVYGPGAVKKETFKLVKREDKWYLYSL